MPIKYYDTLEELNDASIAEQMCDGDKIILEVDHRDEDYDSFRRYGDSEFITYLDDCRYERYESNDLILEIAEHSEREGARRTGLRNYLRDNQETTSGRNRRHDRYNREEQKILTDLSLFDYETMEELETVDLDTKDFILSDPETMETKWDSRTSLWSDYRNKRNDEHYYETLNEYVEDGDVDFKQDDEGKVVMTSKHFTFPTNRRYNIKSSRGRKDKRNPLSVGDRLKIKQARSVINNTTEEEWFEKTIFF
jgi:hypothetical protein